MTYSYKLKPLTCTQAVDYFNYTDQYYITSSSSLKLDNNSKQKHRKSGQNPRISNGY